MKSCDYCGRENEESAASCTGCGSTEFTRGKSKDHAPKYLSKKRESIWLWLGLTLRVAGVLIVIRALAPMAPFPDDPKLGAMTDAKHAADMMYLYQCGFVGVSLFATGWFLRSKAVQAAAS